MNLDTSISELLETGQLTVRSMNVCLSAHLNNLGDILFADLKDLRNARGCGRKTLEELDAIRNRYAYLMDCPETTESSDAAVEKPSDILIAQDNYSHLATEQLASLIHWHRTRYSNLRTRSKNVFPHLADISETIKAAFSPYPLPQFKGRNCGRRTEEEIKAFLAEFRSKFEAACASIHAEAGVTSPKNRHLTHLLSEFPFLSLAECESVANHMLQNDGAIPYLFVAKMYALASVSPQVKICRDYYGINSSYTRRSLADTAYINGVSSERVRQIVTSALPIRADIVQNATEYLKPLIGNVVAFDDPVWETVKRDNMLTENHTQTALLAASLLDTHKVTQISDDDKEYLVNKGLLENVKPRDTFTNLCRIIELRRTHMARLDILHQIKSTDRQYHPDVEQLCPIYAHLIKRKYGLEIENDRVIILMPNALDISIALETILDQQGAPMTAAQLLDEFNRQYPDNAIDSVQKLTPYIFKNKNIRAKASTRQYVLSKWKNHFTGNVTDYMEKLIRDAGEPMPLNDLVQLCQQEFPTTNRKSIQTLLLIDNGVRFVLYEDDLVGMAEMAAPDLKVKIRRQYIRNSFEERFAEFREFVLSAQRMPINIEAERRLVRWMSASLNSESLSEEQKSALIQFLEANRSLPQNNDEYLFKQKCDQVKAIAMKTLRLPSHIDHPGEYVWLHKYIDKYLTYSDNRKAYFEELKSYLQGLGLM